jgi:16S rRNA (uracil1498-N3)-methyltransferase
MAKIHRFIDNFDLSTDKAGLTKNEVEINGEIAHQMSKVLKLEPGEKIELCDGKGICAMAEIVEINKKNVKAKIDKIIENKNTDKKTTLFCAILKKENFELVVQKTTECGISKIVPIISARTIKTGLNIERLQKIAKEASEQSGRNTVPEISEPISFNESLELVKKDNVNILFDSSGEVLQKISNDTPINIWIGPEGGWTEEEIKKARDVGFIISSLGSNTLRGETAAIIATYLISNLQ